MTNENRRRFLALAGHIIGASALAGCAGKGGFPFQLASPGDPELPFRAITAEERRRRRFVNNLLLTHEGEEVLFYDDLLKDKTVLINFIYTLCKNEGLCPMMTYNLSKVQSLLGNRIGKDVYIYSITLDPEYDTPRKLAAYAKHFKPKPGGWKFLTGSKMDIAAVRESSGFRWANPEQDKLEQEHIGIVKYGIEPLERWGTCPALTKPEAIVAYLDWMVPNGKRPMR